MRTFTDDELFDISVHGKTEVIRKYAGKLYLVRQYLTKLSQFAETGHGELDALDWTHIGDLAEVNTRLQQVCEFLGLEAA